MKLIDDKRAYNINITLARFKSFLTVSAIRDAFFAMDEKALNVDVLGSMLKCAPTPEELDVVKGYEGDIEQLGYAEKFFAAVGEVPHIQQRMENFMFKLQFSSVSADVEVSVLSYCFSFSILFVDIFFFFFLFFIDVLFFVDAFALQATIARAESATRALKTSRHLQTVLEGVLAFGNYLNGGTRQGSAYGFRPSTLEKVCVCYEMSTICCQSFCQLSPF